MTSIKLVILSVLATLLAVNTLKIHARNEAFDWYNLPDVKAADFIEHKIEQDIDHFDNSRGLGKF